MLGLVLTVQQHFKSQVTMRGRWNSLYALNQSLTRPIHAKVHGKVMTFATWVVDTKIGLKIATLVTRFSVPTRHGH